MKIRDLEWWIIGILGLIAFILALVGFNILFTEAGLQRSYLDLAFQSMKIFGMEFVDEFQSPLPWQLEVARWLAPGVLLYTAAKAIMYFIRREFKSFLLKFYKDHIIVTSLNEKSRFLISNLREKGEKVIVLAGIDNPRKLDLVEKEGAVIVEGDITSTKFLKNIAGHKTKYFVFLEDDDEANISNAISVYAFLTKYGKDKKQTIFTHVADDIKLNELMDLKFFETYMALNETNRNCEIRIISMFERTARILFNQHSPDQLVPVDAESPQVNVAVIGSGNLAQSMVIRLARLGHFANLQKIKITLFHDGDSIVKKILQNFHGIRELIDFETINAPLELFDMDTFNELHQKQNFSAVYLLCENDSISSNVLKKLTTNTSKRDISVVLTLMNPNGILSKWYHAERVGNIKLKKFNLIEQSFTKEALISEKMDELARVIHEDYLSKVKKIDLNKPSHQDWESLPVDFKNQNREQADHMYIKIRASQCTTEPTSETLNIEFDFSKNPDLVELLAEMEHDRWWAHMLLSGWKPGKVRDDENKIHTDLIPYADLSDDIKQYDKNTVLNMTELLNKLGKKIVALNEE